MTDWRHSQAESHWAAVSRATQMAALGRAADSRWRAGAFRVRLAGWLGRAGVRAAGPAVVVRRWAEAGRFEP